MAGYTMPMYDKLCKAIASGVMRVRYDQGNEVTYQTGEHMLRVKRDMEQALGLDSAGNPIAAGTVFDTTVGVYESGR
jgi:hypothetical protein